MRTISGLTVQCTQIAIRQAFTVWELLAVLAIVLLLIALLISWLAHERANSGRSICAANLKCIVQSMNVYGSDNADAYPIVQYASWTPALNRAAGKPTAANREDLVRSYYRDGRQAGSVQAILWQIATMSDVSPKTMVCDQDPFARRDASLKAADSRYYDNFPHPNQLSYSIAYPWTADGKVGPWWGATIDAAIPIMADVAPLQGSGTPARNVTANPLTKAANSGNHGGDGQMVAFGDNHVEFVRLPDCGQDNDNIYTTSALPSVGPLRYGGIPAGTAAPQLTATKAPYDILMLPARNESTGGF